MKTKVINRSTGEVKEFQMATQKQVNYLRSLENQLGMVVHNHTNKTVWQAKKRIDKLKAKLDSQNLQLF